METFLPTSTESVVKDGTKVGDTVSTGPSDTRGSCLLVAGYKEKRGKMQSQFIRSMILS